MATQITWVIESMQCKPQEGQYTDVVITAYWRCNGVDNTNPDFTGTIYGSCSFPTPGDPFTPYDQLTQDQVLQWCWDNGVNKGEIEAGVDQQIQAQVNPPTVQLPLPWVA